MILAQSTTRSRPGSTRRLAGRLPVPVTVIFGVLLSIANLSAAWENDFADGKKRLAEGNFQEAVELFERAIRSRSRSGVVRSGAHTIDYFPYFFLGRAYLGLREYALAHEQFVKELRGPIRAQPALSAECERELERLRAELTLALDRLPGLLTVGRYELAAVALEDAQSRLPTDPTERARFAPRVEELKRLTHTREPAPPDPEVELAARQGRNYALFFATNEYDDGEWDDLVNPIVDARALAAELRTSYGFDTEVVENPTLSAMSAKLDAYAQRTFADADQLLIFVAGHGIYDKQRDEGFIALGDSPKRFAFAQYLSHSALYSHVSGIRSKHVLLILDVCYGGAFGLTRGDVVYDAPTTAEQISRILQRRSKKFLTSGGIEYVGDGRPGFHSPFVFRLLEAFRRGSGPDRLLTYTDLVGFASLVRPQQPTWGSFADDEPGSDFVFLKVQ